MPTLLHATAALRQSLLRICLFFTCAVQLALPTFAVAQTYRWDGTAPFCSGECNSNEIEITRATSPPGSPPAYNGPQFGSACATGTKALCMTSVGRYCRWDGTAPFCSGACEGNESPAEPPQNSTSGRECVTGSKVYCCATVTRSISARLSLASSSKLVKYAALWEKAAGPAWQARHGLTPAQYQSEFDQLARQGYQLVEVSGAGLGNSAEYAALWEKPGVIVPWAARHGLDANQYQNAFNELTSQGYRPSSISGYVVAGVPRYAAVFEKRQGGAWIARHGLNPVDYQKEFDRHVGQGFRLLDVSGYFVDGEDRYAAIWERSAAPEWVARHGLTSAQYQAEFNRLAQAGFRLWKIRGWNSGGTPKFAAIWVKVHGGPWAARHGMFADAYQEEFDAMAKQGYRLRFVSGYPAFQ